MFLRFFIIVGFLDNLVKIDFDGSLGVSRGPWGPRSPLGTKGSDVNPKKTSFGSRARFAIFQKILENVGALVGSLGRPGGPGKLWGQFLLNNDLAQTPQKGQGVDRSSPQEGRLFGHAGDKKKV